jgi:hypothetical protein
MSSPRAWVSRQLSLPIAVLVSTSCSILAARRSSDQCTGDSDCAPFPETVCDTIQRVCVATDAGGLAPPTNDSAAADAGCAQPLNQGTETCFACPPSTTAELLNACTGSRCYPFDNSARIAGFAPGPLREPVKNPPPSMIDAGTRADAGPADASTESSPPSGNARCSELMPPPVYMMASSALTLSMRTFAQAIASETTLVYKYATSCPSLDSILTGDTRITGTALYWSGNQQLECIADGAQLAEIGGCDVAPETCVPGFTGDPNLVDITGPVQVFMFTVPKASSQTSISAEAAYNVFGFGASSGVDPWTDPSLIFVRDTGSGVQLTIGTTIALPPNSWHGTRVATSAMLKPTLIATADPERTIGPTSADQADEQDGRANLRTLAYQHYGQNCGYLPDSTIGSFDKRNVRDGHYALWAPYHFYTRGRAGRTTDPRIANVVSYFSGAKPLPNRNTDLITALKQGGLVPSCAMRVTREKEGSPIVTYKPSPSCGCYYDVTSPGGSTPPECTSCLQDSDCPPTRSVCSFGYCEPD